MAQQVLPNFMLHVAYLHIKQLTYSVLKHLFYQRLDIYVLLDKVSNYIYMRQYMNKCQLERGVLTRSQGDDGQYCHVA